jgi:hypothetical protein
MSREEIEKLLGGYATGTLTGEERDALFAAALEDQVLFDLLAREEPLRELLEDPVAKARLHRALEESTVAWYRAWLRPALLGALVTGMAVVAVVVERQAARRPGVAILARAPRPVLPVPVSSPLPQALEKREVPQPGRPVEAKPADLQAVATSAAPDRPPPVPAPPSAPPAASPAAVAGQSASAGPAQALERRVVRTNGVSLPSPQDAYELFYGSRLRPALDSNLFRSGQPSGSPAAAGARVGGPALHLGVRYQVLRRLPDRSFADLSSDQELDAKDEVTVLIESNDDGYLSVIERTPEGRWRGVVLDRIARMQPYTVPATGALTFEAAAPIELFIQVSRQPLTTEDRAPAEGSDQVFGNRGTEKRTYVVSTASDVMAQRVGFAITLRHK